MPVGSRSLGVFWLFLVELSLSVAALAADFAHTMSMADPDTMTLKEALKQPDAEEFLKAMVKEVDDHARREHWKIMTISEMISSGCKGKPITMAVGLFEDKVTQRLGGFGTSLF